MFPKATCHVYYHITTFLFYSRFCTNAYLEFHLMLIFQLDVFHELTIGNYAIIDLNWFLVLNSLSHRAHGFAIPFVIIFLTSIFYFFLHYVCSFCFFFFFFFRNKTKLGVCNPSPSGVAKECKTTEKEKTELKNTYATYP